MNPAAVLDEIHKWFSNRDWNDPKNKQFGYWASTHRHYGYEVVLITQNIERVDAAVRSLLEWNYVYRKVNFLGSAVQRFYLCYSYGGDDTNGRGPWPPTSGATSRPFSGATSPMFPATSRKCRSCSTSMC